MPLGVLAGCLAALVVLLLALYTSPLWGGLVLLVWLAAIFHDYDFSCDLGLHVAGKVRGGGSNQATHLDMSHYQQQQLEAKQRLGRRLGSLEACTTSTPLSASYAAVRKTGMFSPNGVGRKEASFSGMKNNSRYSLSELHSSGSSTRPMTPTGPLLNTTPFKDNLRTYVDAKSPGLATRLVQYSEENHHQSLRTHNTKYGSPGLFPIVNLRKSSLPVLTPRAKRCTIRIAPPEAINFTSLDAISSKELLQQDGFPAAASSLPKQLSEEDVSTRSVLDALKEISRKRIHVQGCDADVKRPKKDAAAAGVVMVSTNSGASGGIAAVKRSREDSPPKVIKKYKFPNEIDASLSSSVKPHPSGSAGGVKRKATGGTANEINQKKTAVSVETQTNVSSFEQEATKETQTPFEPIPEKKEKTPQPQQQLKPGKEKPVDEKDGSRTLKEIDEQHSRLPFAAAASSTTTTSTSSDNVGQWSFSPKPLEILRKNKLSTMMSSLTGEEPPKLIPLPVLTLSESIALRKRQLEGGADEPDQMAKTAGAAVVEEKAEKGPEIGGKTLEVLKEVKPAVAAPPPPPTAAAPAMPAPPAAFTLPQPPPQFNFPTAIATPKPAEEAAPVAMPAPTLAPTLAPPPTLPTLPTLPTTTSISTPPPALPQFKLPELKQPLLMGSSLGFNPVTTTTSTAISSSAVTTTPSIQFNFGNSSAVSSSSISFTAAAATTAATTAATSAPAAIPATASNAVPLFGATTTPSFSLPTKTTPIAFGSSSSSVESKKELGAPPAFSFAANNKDAAPAGFGALKPAEKMTPFGATTAGSASALPPPMFTFGAKPADSAAGVASNTNASSGSFSFGDAPKPSGFSFNLVNPAETPSTTSINSTATTTAAAPESSGNPLAKSAVFTFGKPATDSSSGGAAAGGGGGFSSPPTFGSFGKSDSFAGGFGEKKPFAFGAPAAAAVTTAAPTTTAPPPAFGSSGGFGSFASGGGGFAASAPANSNAGSFTFGQKPPPPAFGAATSSAGGFGSFSSGAPPSFAAFSAASQPQPPQQQQQQGFGATPAPPAFNFNSSSAGGGVGATAPAGVFSFNSGGAAAAPAQSAPAFQFGAQEQQAQQQQQQQKPFTFSAAAPSFNFNAAAAAPAAPGSFGQFNAPNAGVFSIGTGASAQQPKRYLARARRRN